MKQVLVPDLSATIEIDPEFEKSRAELERQEAELERLRGDPKISDEDVGEFGQAIEGQRQALAEYEATEGRPVVVIGFVPPAKLSALKSQAARKRPPKFSSKTVEEMSDEERNALMDFSDHNAEYARETCRWGVRDWRLQWQGNPVEFETEKAEHRGREYPVATHAVVDIIEAAGWLDAVATAIWRYNTLDEEMRKK